MNHGGQYRSHQRVFYWRNIAFLTRNTATESHAMLTRLSSILIDGGVFHNVDLCPLAPRVQVVVTPIIPPQTVSKGSLGISRHQHATCATNHANSREASMRPCGLLVRPAFLGAERLSRETFARRPQYGSQNCKVTKPCPSGPQLHLLCQAIGI